MHAFVTYLGNIGPPFVASFFEPSSPFVCTNFLMNRNIPHILLVKRSLVLYGALSCSIEFCALLKGKTGFVHELKLLMRLAKLIKDVFFFFGIFLL